MFADFAADSVGNFYLVRISFDGYGCCTTDADITSMSADDSTLLAAFISCNDVDNEATRDILRRYLDANRNRLWCDALVEHDLLPP